MPRVEDEAQQRQGADVAQLADKNTSEGNYAKNSVAFQQSGRTHSPPLHAKSLSSHQPPALLVVEDDPDDFMLLKRALYRTGATARVWWARDLQEALSMLEELERATRRICVVMDLRMAGTDGWDLLARIRARPRSSEIKCALLTGMSDPGTRARADVEGADAFFTKPCDVAGLAEIARALQRLASS